jgi:hypothetical protein
MSDIPASNTIPLLQGNISPCDITSIGSCTGLGTPSSIAWPAQYLALFVPFRISVPVKITNAWWYNGTPVSASYKIDVGIYSADLTKLGSTGLTAQGSALTIQNVALTTELGPGLFYMAMTNNYTESFWSWAANLNKCRIWGMFQQLLTTPYSLPATATPAACAFTVIPIFGLTSRSFV